MDSLLTWALNTLFWVGQVCYLYLPAAFANMAPPTKLFRKLLPFGRPIWCPEAKDMSLRELEVFLATPALNTDEEARKTAIKLSGLGTNKTYRGLLAAIIAATIVCCVQWVLYVTFDDVRSFALYGNPNPFLLGFLWGFGAMAGDAAESLIMRRLGHPPGAVRKSDRIDFILGASVLVAIFAIPLGFREVILATVLALFLHPLIKGVGLFFKVAQDGLDIPKTGKSG